jgi:hypothetical protein
MDEFSLFPDLEGLLRNLWRKYKCRYTYLSGGFLLDYCASREHARMGRASELWQTGLMAHALHTIPPRKENGNGE